jgi:Ca-activated chloride channel family protein
VFSNFTFAYPEAALLLPLLAAALWWRWKGRKGQAAIRLSTLPSLPSSPRVRWRPLINWLRILALLALVVALARPQRRYVRQVVESEGIDIVLALDVSGSMLAEDLKPNRIDAAREVAMDFVDARPADRIGLVVFSGESFTQVPVTPDHDMLRAQIADLHSGVLRDGTAIGAGLATAVDRLRTVPGESRVVILLTDGVNNAGNIDPLTALAIAKTYRVRVYTIGVGTTGQAPFPMNTPFGVQKTMVPVEIDEALLQRIATETGGKYFRATSNRALESIYEEIDRLEKREVETSTYQRRVELFYPFALAALVLLMLEVVLRNTVFRGAVE